MTYEEAAMAMRAGTMVCDARDEDVDDAGLIRSLPGEGRALVAWSTGETAYADLADLRLFKTAKDRPDDKVILNFLALQTCVNDMAGQFAAMSARQFDRMPWDVTPRDVDALRGVADALQAAITHLNATARTQDAP